MNAIEIQEQFRATDEPTKQDYQFQQFEDIKHEDPEYAEWGGKQRPKDKLTVQDQENTPACTCYSNGHVANALNILEDAELLENRPQINPSIWWDEFCVLRNNRKTGTSIQTMAQFFKNKGVIEWYVTIGNTETNVIAKMKKAIDNGNFLCTGSSNGDWTATGKTGNYTLRTDWKFVGHAWAIVDYWADYFWAINSWWPSWWIYWGYFKVPNELVTQIYNKLAIIDKNDSFYFQKMKDRVKVEQVITLCKELYGKGSQQVKDYFEKIQLGANLENLYK